METITIKYNTQSLYLIVKVTKTIRELKIIICEKTGFYTENFSLKLENLLLQEDHFIYQYLKFGNVFTMTNTILIYVHINGKDIEFYVNESSSIKDFRTDIDKKIGLAKDMFLFYNGRKLFEEDSLLQNGVENNAVIVASRSSDEVFVLDQQRNPSSSKKNSNEIGKIESFKCLDNNCGDFCCTKSKILSMEYDKLYKELNKEGHIRQPLEQQQPSQKRKTIKNMFGSMGIPFGVLGFKKKDRNVEIDKVEAPSGLLNNMANCYMNAMMQALASSTRLIVQMEDLFQTMNERFENLDKLEKFIDILKTINRPFYTDDSTKKLKIFLNTVVWNSSSQQDAFQLLSFFINAIHKDIGFDTIMPPKLKLLHEFSENSNFNKIQEHLALALPLCGSYSKPPGVGLSNLMDEFFSSNIIDDGRHGTTTMYIFGNSAPDVLLLHIQANEWKDGIYVKPEYYVDYDNILSYEFRVTNNQNGSEKRTVKTVYQLVAVVHHIGSVSSGHYITYRKAGKLWYEVDDCNVKLITFTFEVEPYIMVYEKLVELQ